MPQFSAAPFDTTFIVAFCGDEFSEIYERFVRSTHMSIDLDIVNLFHKQKGLPTQYYDGPTHTSYLNPSRVWEAWYCQSKYGGRDNNMCGFLSNFYDPSMHTAQTIVKRDPVKGRGLYAANDIVEGSFLNPDDSHLNLHIHRYQWKALNQFIEDYPDAHMYRQLRDFYLSYGFENEGISNFISGWTVSYTPNTFVNHVCDLKTETSEGIPFDLDSEEEEVNFSLLGNRRKFIGTLTMAKRNITKGEDILQDYSGFRSRPSAEYFELLQSFCDFGEGLVPVEFEEEKTSNNHTEL